MNTVDIEKVEPENSIFERLFHITEKGSSVKNEVLAGLTTFVAMSYIMFVNPNIMADAGIPKDAAIAATIYAAVISSLMMGLWANFPVAVAPGMGINAFFAYYICGKLGLPWQIGLGIVFISGLIFMLLTITKARQYIINAVPVNLKSSIVVGLGLFISFIGLHNAGIIINDNNTLVTLGDLRSTDTLLACFGLALTVSLVAKEVRGAILYGILITTFLGMVLGRVVTPDSIVDIVSHNLPSLTPTLLQLDIAGAFHYALISVIFTFTTVVFFDNLGTLIGVSRKAKLMDDQGNISGIERALITNATGTVCSSLLGTSTVTSYVESATGVAEGGRTGLTAVVVAILFALSLFFAPLIGTVPSFATAPALIIVGVFMLMEVVHVKFDTFSDAFPALMVIIMMPLTYSIAHGFAFGFVSYTVLKIFSGKYNEVSWIMWLMTIAFVINFYLR